MRSRPCFLSSLWFAASVVAGCGCPEPSASVDVSGSPPTFSWFGTDAYQIFVAGAEGNVWSAQCNNGRNCLSPPVEYGEARPNLVWLLDPEPLARESYEVSVCALCENDVVNCGPSTAFEVE